VGRDGFELVHPEDLERTRRFLFKAVQSPRVPIHYECRILRAQGDWIAVEAYITNLLDELHGWILPPLVICAIGAHC
jgi:PAS fold